VRLLKPATNHTLYIYIYIYIQYVIVIFLLILRSYLISIRVYCIYPLNTCSPPPAQSLSDKLSRSDKDQQELREALGAERAAGQGFRTALHERELELQEAQGRASGADASLQRAQAELGEKGEEVARLKQEALELQVKHGELNAERKQLQQQREERESQGAQQQSEIGQVTRRHLEGCYSP